MSKSYWLQGLTRSPLNSLIYEGEQKLIRVNGRKSNFNLHVVSGKVILSDLILCNV